MSDSWLNRMFKLFAAFYVVSALVCLAMGDWGSATLAALAATLSWWLATLEWWS